MKILFTGGRNMNSFGATREVRNKWSLSKPASSFSEVCNNYWSAGAAAEVLHKVDYWTKYYLQLGMEILTDRLSLSFAHTFHIEDFPSYFSFLFSGGVCFKTIISFLPFFYTFLSSSWLTKHKSLPTSNLIKHFHYYYNYSKLDFYYLITPSSLKLIIDLYLW